jgi:hypothetical protein
VAADPTPIDVSFPREHFSAELKGSPTIWCPVELVDARMPCHDTDAKAGREWSVAVEDRYESEDCRAKARIVLPR